MCDQLSPSNHTFGSRCSACCVSSTASGNNVGDLLPFLALPVRLAKTRTPRAPNGATEPHDHARVQQRSLSDVLFVDISPSWRSWGCCHQLMTKWMDWARPAARAEPILPTGSRRDRARVGSYLGVSQTLACTTGSQAALPSCWGRRLADAIGTRPAPWNQGHQPCREISRSPAAAAFL